MKEAGRSMASLVQEEHDSLKETMAAIRSDLESDARNADFANWRLNFVWRLRDFQSALLKHFDLEEDGGFMEELVAVSPGCTARVALLKQEHEDIIPRLNELTDELKEMTSKQPITLNWVAAGLIDLFDLLERHEAAERELIQDVYFQDIGVGD